MEKFTVIIPTKDRCETLAHTLESCLAVQDAHFEILVSDNHSVDATPEVLAAFKARDARVRCIRPPHSMGMSLHYEFALDHVTEGFVLILGSDDALLPGAVTRARAALQNHPDAEVLHGVACMYFYPDFYSDDAGLIYARITPCDEVRNSREWLLRAMASECGAADLPMPYQMTWVRNPVFDRLKQKTGRRLHSCFPDYFLAVAVAAVTEEFVHVSPGFGVSGISSKSIGLSSSYPKASRSAENSFLSENEIPVHPKVNHTRSLFVVLGETLLRAQEAGLLPEGATIAWDRMVSRACVQFFSEPWDEAQRRENIAVMRTIAANFGCAQALDGMGDTPESVRAWAAQLPYLHDWHLDEWEAVLDGRLIGVHGVHEAARMIEAMIETSLPATRGLNAARATEEEFLAWGILEQAKQAATLRRQLRDVNRESERRAAERDRAKQQLTTVREKNEKLRAKATDGGGTTSKKWIPKWLRGR